MCCFYRGIQGIHSLKDGGTYIIIIVIIIMLFLIYCVLNSLPSWKFCMLFFVICCFFFQNQLLHKILSGIP